MTDAGELGPLRPEDRLGREVFSRSRAERARKRGLVAHDIFLERLETVSLSADRLDHTTNDEMTIIADRTGAERGQAFFGWATVTVAQAEQGGRTAVATPRPHNRYHADIELNIRSEIDRRDAQKQHANELAKWAVWRERAPNTDPAVRFRLAADEWPGSP